MGPVGSKGGKGRIIKRTSPQKKNSEILFVVCRRKKSQPKIPPLVCEKRCPRFRKCQDYLRYLQPGLFDHAGKKKR